MCYFSSFKYYLLMILSIIFYSLKYYLWWMQNTSIIFRKSYFVISVERICGNTLFLMSCSCYIFRTQCEVNVHTKNMTSWFSSSPPPFLQCLLSLSLYIKKQVMPYDSADLRLGRAKKIWVSPRLRLYMTSSFIINHWFYFITSTLDSQYHHA